METAVIAVTTVGESRGHSEREAAQLKRVTSDVLKTGEMETAGTISRTITTDVTVEL